MKALSKKKKAPPSKEKPTAASPSSRDESTTDADGFLCVTGDRLWKWRALDAELRMSLAELNAVKQGITTEVALHPALVELFARQTDLLHAVSTGRAELATMHAEIEAVYGVSLKECSIDDKTGRLHNLTAEGTRGEPLPDRGSLDKPKTSTKTKTPKTTSRKTRKKQ